MNRRERNSLIVLLLTAFVLLFLIASRAQGAASHETKLRNAGVAMSERVLNISRDKEIKPWRSVAMMNMETGIPQRNIFGCDYGPLSGPPYCNQRVTRRRVLRLKNSSYSNGIGWTQITYKPLVRFYGGRWREMHRPPEQMRVGFAHLAALQRTYGEFGGFLRYNGSGSAAYAYAARAVELATYWKARGGW